MTRADMPGRCQADECWLDPEVRARCDGNHYVIDDPAELARTARRFRIALARLAPSQSPAAQ